MFRLVQRQSALGARAYSSQAPSKLAATAASLAQRSSVVAKNTIYYSKVFGELLKYVWVNERLSPPTTQEIRKTFTTDLKSLFDQSLKASKEPAKLVQTAGKWSSDDYIRGAAAVVQLFGIFALGEVIGRRHVYGYKDHKHAH